MHLQDLFDCVFAGGSSRLLIGKTGLLPSTSAPTCVCDRAPHLLPLGVLEGDHESNRPTSRWVRGSRTVPEQSVPHMWRFLPQSSDVFPPPRGTPNGPSRGSWSNPPSDPPGWFCGQPKW